jgi:hypothetical protein
MSNHGECNSGKVQFSIFALGTEGKGMPGFQSFQLLSSLAASAKTSPLVAGGP